MVTNETKRVNGQSPVFANQLTTVEDLINFKRELLSEIKQLISTHSSLSREDCLDRISQNSAGATIVCQARTASRPGV
ncbi:MAG: hypothetical protein JWR67_1393 [Mucilaginibacter sp.]|nr:hypothetical protein [Mucilaginibacter sp.]